MSEQDLVERIKALPGRGRKTKIARLRIIIDDVEAALARGVPRNELLKELNRGESGLGMTLASFATTLKRVREERIAKHGGAMEVSNGDAAIHEDTSSSHVGSPTTGKRYMSELLPRKHK